jgi:hypothetical protein
VTEAEKFITGTLALIDTIGRHVDTIRTLPELAALRDRADAQTEILKLARESLETRNFAAQLKIRIERRIGQILAENSPRGGDRRSNGRKRPDEKTPEISERNVKRCRKLAGIPEGELIAYFHDVTESGLELSTDGLLRHWAEMNRVPKDGEEVPKEVKPANGEPDEPITTDFWKSARTCREEVNRCMRKLKDVRLVLSGLMESPYKALLKKSAHGDKAVELAWDGREKLTDLPLGATLVEKVYTCPALDSLIQFVGALRPLFDREADREGPA